MGQFEMMLSPRSLSVGTIDEYIRWVNQIPLLTPQEEQDCARRLAEEGDLEAAKRMVMAHLRLVVSIARGYSGYGLAQADLIQEGNIGLMKAVKRFCPEKGVRLVSFAIHWIRAEIHEFIIKNWRIVKVATTKAQRKVFFNLRKMTKNFSWLSQDEVRSVSQALGVEQRDVLQMESRMKHTDVSFEAKPGSEDEEWKQMAATLSDPSAGPEEQVINYDLEATQHARLKNAIEQLDPRSASIIRARWLNEDKLTLSALAKEHGVSLERVRQIEKSAMATLQKLVAV